MTTDTTPQFSFTDTTVEPIQFLDDEGNLLDGATPALDDDQVLEALHLMMLGRTFDTKSFSLQRQGKLGTFAPMVGQEASFAGSAMALDPKTDWVAPQYREFIALVRQGYAPETIALYRMGHPDGGHIPEGVNVLQHQISLAAQIPHAVGLGWGMKLKGSPGVSVAYFGEGSSSEGDFHESMILAGVVKAPVIFFLSNNQWAISTPREIQSAAADLSSRAQGYGMPGVSVDGNDLLAVHKVTAEAVARARAGEGPTLIEAHTFRMWAHTTADDPTRYVNPEVKKRWAKRDPIDRIQKYLAKRNRWGGEMIEAWEREINERVEAIFESANNHRAPTPEDVYEHTFVERNPTLERQRAWNLSGTEG